MDLSRITEITLVVLTLLVPVLLLPLLMRFIVSRIVLALVKKAYLPESLRKAHEGWRTGEDLTAIDGVSTFALRKMRYHFVFQYNFLDDLQAVLLIVQNAYDTNRKNPEQLVYSFSFRRLLECSLLAFTDLYREYSSQAWFRIIRNTRIIWFRRVGYVVWFTNLVTNIRFFRGLQHTRIHGILIRFILIPVLGIPSLIWYSLKSLGIGTFYEGFFRYFYGSLLLKTGYYAMYLYGRKNTSISRRMAEFPGGKLDELAREIELLLHPTRWTKKSSFYDEAIAVYTDLLVGFGLGEDDHFLDEVSIRRHPLKRFLKRVLSMTKKAYGKDLPFNAKPEGDLEHLLLMYRSIGAVYFPRAKEPLLFLRINEALELGYMASVLTLQKLLSTPGVNIILDSITIDLVLKLKSFADLDFIRSAASRLSDSFKFYKAYQRVNRVLRTIHGAGAPFTLLWHLGSPMIYQQLQDLLRRYVYMRAGRLLIYGWETNLLRTKGSLSPLPSQERSPGDPERPGHGTRGIP